MVTYQISTQHLPVLAAHINGIFKNVLVAVSVYFIW